MLRIVFALAALVLAGVARADDKTPNIYNWSDYIDPANADKLRRCGISLLDAADEMIPVALLWRGIDPLSRDPLHGRRGGACFNRA